LVEAVLVVGLVVGLVAGVVVGGVAERSDVHTASTATSRQAVSLGTPGILGKCATGCESREPGRSGRLPRAVYWGDVERLAICVAARLRRER
jgi:hypothetical protein